MIKEISGIHDDAITSVAFSRYEGNKLLTNSCDGTVKLVDLRMYGEVVKCFKDKDLEEGIYEKSKALISNGGNIAAV